jgi:hypothetical protein
MCHEHDWTSAVKGYLIPEDVNVRPGERLPGLLVEVWACVYCGFVMLTLPSAPSEPSKPREPYEPHPDDPF